LTPPFLLANTGLESVPADFIKNAMLFLAFLVSIGFNWLMWSQRNRTQKREVTGALETMPRPVYAHQSELVELVARVERLEIQQQKDTANIMQAGLVREASIKDCITTRNEALKDALFAKFEEWITQAYHRINEHAERIARVEARQEKGGARSHG
jgi:hypothetical protein